MAAILAQGRVLADEHRFDDAIELLTHENRTRRDPHLESELIHLRHESFPHLDLSPAEDPWPPVVVDSFDGVDGCPTVAADELTAELLTSAITHHGALLVRGLVTPADVDQMVASIDESFRACDARQLKGVGEWPGSWFQPFRGSPEYPDPEIYHRAWVRAAGGVLAADSPPSFFTMVEMFERAGLREVITDYLGERPVLSVDKCTLRRVPLDLTNAEWHQDGSFLGDGIRTLNVWLALSACGGDEPSPGLDLVPRRFDELVPSGTEGSYFDWAVSPQMVAATAADTPVIRPRFEAGDALLFDHLFLHRTALEPTMDTERYAIESWFFASSRYPGTSIPIVF